MGPSSFSQLPLRPELLTGLAALDYQAMTPIQAEALPPLLAGRDLIAQAVTGSGKTAAFALGLLNFLDAQSFCTQALVLAPTRELADQVAGEIRRLASAIPNTKVLTLCGGRPIGPQLASLRRAPHVVVGTPGRILKHLQAGSLRLDAVAVLVLDEADRMLDMGFQDDMQAIIANVPGSRQTLLFSATYPPAIRQISREVQRDPVDVRIEPALDNRPDIEQVFVEVEPVERLDTLYRVIAHYRPESCLVFCNTRQQCQQVVSALRRQGLHALALHGDLEQNERDQVLACFAGRSATVLVATDVAARGLDVKELVAVINFELARDPEVHIHRIGRTARAGKRGLAVSLFSGAELRRLQAIEELQGEPVVATRATGLEIPVNFRPEPPMVTLCVNGGRRDRIRPGDLLGALTAGGELSGEQIGKITLCDRVTYVAVTPQAARTALAILAQGRIKGKNFRARKLG